jgi:uncharacterized membrane protein
MTSVDLVLTAIDAGIIVLLAVVIYNQVRIIRLYQRVLERTGKVKVLLENFRDDNK